MAERCFGCGKFIRLGEGNVVSVKESDGFHHGYFCAKCAAERLDYIQRSQGPEATFHDYIGRHRIIETV